LPRRMPSNEWAFPSGSHVTSTSPSHFLSHKKNSRSAFPFLRENRRALRLNSQRPGRFCGTRDARWLHGIWRESRRGLSQEWLCLWWGHFDVGGFERREENLNRRFRSLRQVVQPSSWSLPGVPIFSATPCPETANSETATNVGTVPADQASSRLS
jgi:hypothetical protein